MKVILLQNVKGRGQAGDVIEVADGYARNFMLPQKLGKQASDSEVEQTQKQLEKKKRVSEQEQKNVQNLATKVQGKETVINAEQVSEGGKLFAAIDEKTLREAVNDQFGVKIPEGAITVKEPIKSIGNHTISINFHNTSAELTVVVKEATK